MTESADLEVSPTPSTELLSRYRLELARSARPLKVYPAIARENGWEGTVVMAIEQLPGGLPMVSLSASSGHAVLDRLALDMLAQAAAGTVVAGLRGQGLRVSVSVVYGQDD